MFSSIRGPTHVHIALFCPVISAQLSAFRTLKNTHALKPEPLTPQGKPRLSSERWPTRCHQWGCGRAGGSSGAALRGGGAAGGHCTHARPCGDGRHGHVLHATSPPQPNRLGRCRLRGKPPVRPILFHPSPTPAHTHSAGTSTFLFVPIDYCGPAIVMHEAEMVI